MSIFTDKKDLSKKAKIFLFAVMGIITIFALYLAFTYDDDMILGTPKEYYKFCVDKEMMYKENQELKRTPLYNLAILCFDNYTEEYMLYYTNDNNLNLSWLREVKKSD